MPLLTPCLWLFAGVPALLPEQAYVHGACLVVLDGLAVSTGQSETTVEALRMQCARKLQEQVGRSARMLRVFRWRSMITTAVHHSYCVCGTRKCAAHASGDRNSNP